jgi:hypothetical protein
MRFLRACLALALPRLELFLRVATRFFALAMAVSREVCRRQAKSWISIRAIRKTELYTYCAGHRGSDLDQSLLRLPATMSAPGPLSCDIMWLLFQTGVHHFSEKEIRPQECD